MAAAFAIAGSLQIAFELSKAAFVLFHTHTTRYPLVGSLAALNYSMREQYEDATGRNMRRFGLNRTISRPVVERLPTP